MKLSDFELDVMQFFWQHGDCSSKQIHQWVCESKPAAYTTVKTIIDRLEEKKALQRVGKDGRSLIFKAAISRKDMTPSVLPGFVKRFFGGSNGSLISHLLDDDKLSTDDIEYLEQYLANKKAKEKNNN